MRTLAIIIAASLTILAAGCGGSATSDTSPQPKLASNNEKIQQAEQQQQTVADIRSKLTRELRLYSDSSLSDEKDTFDAGDNQCKVGQILVPPEAEMYADQAWSLVSPTGSVVEVSAYEDDSDAACMQAARGALDW